MTIKRKIFYLNTITVVASLIVMLAVIGMLILFFKKEFLNQFSKNYNLSQNTFEIQEILKDADKYKDDWKQLDDKLSEYNFRLYVTSGSESKKKHIYSSVKRSENESLEELIKNKSDDLKPGDEQIYYIEGTTIIKYSIISGDSKYILFAADCPKENSFFGMDKGLFEVVLLIFFVVGIIAIVFILFCCQIVTKVMINRILKPVKLLDSAAKRVGEGNISEPITYLIDDEFKSVCDSFNLMQLNLKRGMEVNEAYEKARIEMVSGISHDLRTPLTSIKGYIKGILDGVAASEDKRQQYLEIAYKKSCDMDVLISKLFYFSKMETGNMPFFMKKIDLVEYVNNYVSDRKTELEEKNISLNFYAEKTQLFCNIDCEQMKRVFQNIIQNSIKYSEKDDLQINITIKEIMDSQNKYARLEISDNGAGAPEEKLPHLFEQFYRADESRNSKHDGNGLGLYVCKYIINKFGGKIKAVNKDGFTIIIDLPCI